MPRIFGRIAEVQPEPTGTEPAETVPDDLAEALAILRAEAADLENRADRADREMEAAIAAADEEAERSKATVRQQALTVRAETTADRREAAHRAERAALIAAAIAEQDRGAEALQHGAQLEAERIQLLGTIEDLDATIAARGADQERAGAELAAAETAADIPRTEKAASTLAAAGRVLASLAGQRQRAAERLQEVGDGSGATGEHGAACSATAGHYAKATELLDLAYPDTEDAAQRRWLAEFRATAEANAQRITEEAAAAGKPEPRQIAYL
jgi:hypothetical protein